MDWVISALTIVSMELIARKHWYGWGLGIFNQFLWCYVLVWDKQMYGLTPIPLILFWRYSVALLRWKREALCIVGATTVMQ
jgi:hypothetical protein